MSSRKLQRIASALFGLALMFGLTLGPIAPNRGFGHSLPTVGAFGDDPGADIGGGG